MSKMSKKTIEMMWQDFDVPINEYEEIDDDWCGWERLTNREEIWQWFDEQYAEHGGVYALMFPDERKESPHGVVMAHVNFQQWVHDYAIEVGSESFDCARALDELPLDVVRNLETGRADYNTDDVYNEAVRLGLVKEHDGPFDCYIDNDFELEYYIERRNQAEKGA